MTAAAQRTPSTRVAPRDGLRMEAVFVPTDDKVAWIDLLGTLGYAKIDCVVRLGGRHPGAARRRGSGLEPAPREAFSPRAPRLRSEARDGVGSFGEELLWNEVAGRQRAAVDLAVALRAPQRERVVQALDHPLQTPQQQPVAGHLVAPLS